MRKCFGLAGLLGSLVLLAAAQAGGNNQNFYPLQVGNTWSFQVKQGANNVNMVTRIAKTEDINGQTVSVLEGLVNGKVVATEHLLQNAKGVFRVRYNGQEINPPICLVKYPVMGGDKWQSEIAVANSKAKVFCEAQVEKVDVPAGKFDSARIDITVEEGAQKVKMSYWFAANVGIVKQRIDAGGAATFLELEKFEIKK